MEIRVRCAKEKKGINIKEVITKVCSRSYPRKSTTESVGHSREDRANEGPHAESGV